ncbi:MAG: hypothetical protein ACI8RZ_005282 [Myxococcota bacterium]|jgi:hypothetical protein
MFHAPSAPLIPAGDPLFNQTPGRSGLEMMKTGYGGSTSAISEFPTSSAGSPGSMPIFSRGAVTSGPPESWQGSGGGLMSDHVVIGGGISGLVCRIFSVMAPGKV